MLFCSCRVLCRVSLAALMVASMLTALVVCGGSYLRLQQYSTARKGDATRSTVSRIVSLPCICVMISLGLACSAAMLTASSMTAAMDHTLGVALHRASEVETHLTIAVQCPSMADFTCQQ